MGLGLGEWRTCSRCGRNGGSWANLGKGEMDKVPETSGEKRCRWLGPLWWHPNIMESAPSSVWQHGYGQKHEWVDSFGTSSATPTLPVGRQCCEKPAVSCNVARECFSERCLCCNYWILTKSHLVYLYFKTFYMKLFVHCAISSVESCLYLVRPLVYLQAKLLSYNHSPLCKWVDEQLNRLAASLLPTARLPRQPCTLIKTENDNGINGWKSFSAACYVKPEILCRLPLLSLIQSKSVWMRVCGLIGPL